MPEIVSNRLSRGFVKNRKHLTECDRSPRTGQMWTAPRARFGLSHSLPGRGAKAEPLRWPGGHLRVLIRGEAESRQGARVCPYRAGGWGGTPNRPGQSSSSSAGGGRPASRAAVGRTQAPNARGPARRWALPSRPVWCAIASGQVTSPRGGSPARLKQGMSRLLELSVEPAQPGG